MGNDFKSENVVLLFDTYSTDSETFFPSADCFVTVKGISS